MNVATGQIRRMPIDELHAAPYNPRSITDEALSGLCESLRNFGQAGVVIWNDRTQRLVGGHQTVKAAKRLGWTEIDAKVVDLDEADEKALNVALNNEQIQGEWTGDLETLLAEIQQDRPAIYDALLLSELSAAEEGGEGAGAEDPGAQTGRADELCEQWGVESGQLWEIEGASGQVHRLLCGDATDGETVKRLLDGAEPFLMATDPPYGVEYDPAWRSESFPDGPARREGEVQNDNRVDWSDAYSLFPGDVAYVWYAAWFAAEIVIGLRDIGFEVRTQLIWRKQKFAISRGHYHWQHEPCWYAVRKGRTAKWCGDRSQSTVWDIGANDGGDGGGHGTQKPLECMARPIRNHGEAGDGVYDPFVGSGTTIVAAEQLNRRCFAMELHSPYVAVCLQRMTDMGATCRKADT